MYMYTHIMDTHTHSVICVIRNPQINTLAPIGTHKHLHVHVQVAACTFKIIIIVTLLVHVFFKLEKSKNYLSVFFVLYFIVLAQDGLIPFLSLLQSSAEKDAILSKSIKTGSENFENIYHSNHRYTYR